jgi:hypothetical protein
MSTKKNDPDVVPAQNEAVMIVLYLLCLHPQTLRYIITGEGSPFNGDQGIIDTIQLKYPNAITAFRSLHNRGHIDFVAGMFEGFNRDFLLTLREYDRLDGTHLKVFDDDYDDPNTCPGDNTIGNILPAAQN